VVRSALEVTITQDDIITSTPKAPVITLEMRSS